VAPLPCDECTGVDDENDIERAARIPSEMGFAINIARIATDIETVMEEFQEDAGASASAVSGREASTPSQQSVAIA
jgi:hypothetical protein